MNKLWIRLSLGFGIMVLAAVFVVAVTGILVGRGDRRGPDGGDDRGSRRLQTTQLVNDLTRYYQDNQGWAGSEALLLEAQANMALTRWPDRNLIYVLADSNKQIIFHIQEKQIGRPLDDLRHVERIPVQLDGQIIGYLGSIPSTLLHADNGPPEFAILLGRTLLSAAAVAGIGGIIFGIVMSRTLTAPLDNLEKAAKDIGARNLSRRVEEKGTEEIIAVAHAFNNMAADLEQAERLRRNLLADVAHELRTPLSVLQGNLRAILDEVYPLNQEEIVRLYEHTRFLSRLVTDLHELAQAEAHKLPLDVQESNLAHLINTVTDNFQPDSEANDIALRTDIAASLPSVEIDPARMTQVLQNLLANALRHTPAGGAITIGARSEADAVHLTVSDTGEGIAMEHLPYIFDRFYRADPARTRDRGGAGLGLAISRAIVEAHQGQISASSDISGSGTTFTIRLPLSQSIKD